VEIKKRRKGPAVGLEYRWGWLGAQVARHRDHFSANAYVSIPVLGTRVLPKLLEPAPFDPKKRTARVSAPPSGKPSAATAPNWCRRWSSRTSRTSASNSTATPQAHADE
jgi:hypothetical protein